jgi:hypothetical protein
MMELTGTVGEHGANATHDVSIVQAMLCVAHRPAAVDRNHRPYLRTIHGSADKHTRDAIKLFQSDHAPRSSSDKPSGTITSGDSTWTALVAEMPVQLKYLRALPGSRIVYLEADAAALQANLLALNALTFESGFAEVVTELLNRIHLLYGIAISVNDDGDRRTFQKQMDIFNRVPRVTGSGPGESNHNFGRAVDLGFKNLKWLQPNSVVVQRESSMLKTMDPKLHGAGQAGFFWDMLRDEGKAIGMYPGPLGDRPHLQDFDDAINSAARLGVLLSQVGVMTWTGHTVHGHRHYECDLGEGGKMFNVGTSIQIWNRSAPVTTHMLDEARRQTEPSTPHATAKDVSALQEALRADFVTADARWSEWTPA